MIISDIVTNKKDSVEEKVTVVQTLSKNTGSSKQYRPLETDIFEEKKNAKRTVWLWALFMVAVIAGGVYLWHKYAYATVILRTQEAPYAFTSTPFTAVRSGNSDSDTMPFEVMVIDDIYKQTVTYGTKNIATKKSRGSILVQNSASSKKIILKKGSVAVSNNNMRYVVLNSANIPGYTKKGTVITPGSAEVMVEAEKNGAEYNVTGANFTFPNYTSKSTLLTAKTIGLGIVRGANGNMYTMTDDEVTAITKNIQESAKNKIFIKANAEIPPGYRIYKNAVVYNAEPISNLRESSTAVREISQSTTLTAYLFRDRDIEKYIFTHSEHALQEPLYTVSGIDQTDIKLNSQPTDPKNTTTLSLQFTGNGIITWSIDKNALLTALAGVNKKSTETIFAGFKTIDTATITTNPWFERTVPIDTKRIHVDIQN